VEQLSDEVGMKPKFKKRYVLGEGYPWVFGMDHYKGVGLTSITPGTSFKDLEWPEELWDRKLPLYRLELVRVDKNK